MSDEREESRGEHGRVLATYQLEAPGDLVDAAEVLAGEQSTGTFVAVAGQDATLQERYAARVENILELEPVARPSLPSRLLDPDSGGCRRALVTVSLPAESADELTTLLAAVAGNVFEIAQVTALRLVRLRLPVGALGRHPRPRHGLAGTRRLVERPLGALTAATVGGVSPAEHASATAQALAAGADVCIDAWRIADPVGARFAERVPAALDAVARSEGHALYVPTATGDLDELLRRGELIQRLGGTSIGIDLGSVGLTAVGTLRRHLDLVLYGRPAAVPASDALGVDQAVAALIWRLAGVDQIVMRPRPTGGFDEAMVDACLDPLLDDADRSVPVLPMAESPADRPDHLPPGTMDDILLLAERPERVGLVR